MQIGTTNFETYNRTLRRILWAEFLDEQLKMARENQFKARLVQNEADGGQSLVAAIGSTRTELGSG